MLKNFVLALRTIKNYRLYTIINIVGLALSLACIITISRYLYSELSVDKVHTQVDNIYAVVSQQEGDILYRQDESCNPNKVDGFVDMGSDAAVIERSTTVCIPTSSITHNNHDFTANILAVDSSFTKIFSFAPTMGSLDEIGGSVDKGAITEAYAKKIFGTQNPIGQVITANSGDFTIVGVVATPKGKTSLNFDLMLPLISRHSWGRMPNEYYLMPNSFDYGSFNQKYSGYMKIYSNSNGMRFSVKPLRDIYFDESIVRFNAEMTPTGNSDTLRTIFIITIAILVVGLFNFVNIYTTLMMRRSREMGIKKVFGASTAAITTAIYVENLTMVALSVLFGWITSELLLPLTSSVLDIPFISNPLFDTILSLAIIAIVPLLTTIYPYFKYRLSKPIKSLQQVGSTRGSITSRALLLVLQYTITIILVIVSLYFVHQLNYMLNADLGYKNNGIVEVNFMAENQPKYRYKDDNEREQAKAKRRTELSNSSAIMTQLDSSPLFSQVSLSSSPAIEHTYKSKFTNKQTNEEAEAVVVYGDSEFFDMYGVDIIEGRAWSDTIDRWAQYKFIVNETFLREFGITTFRDVAVQPENRLWYSHDGNLSREQNNKLMSRNPAYEIVGVMRDYQMGHLSQRTPAVAMSFEKNDKRDVSLASDAVYLQVAESKMSEAISYIEELHLEYGTGELRYKFMKDVIATMYKEDRRVTNIYSTFALVAIIIGALGLFSLSLYDVQQRRREIALRRVNGATVNEIIALLLKKYYILLAISCVVAMPSAYYIIEQQMVDFATRAPLSWWIFAVAGALTAAISLLTLLWQTISAAKTNPVIAMKRG